MRTDLLICGLSNSVLRSVMIAFLDRVLPVDLHQGQAGGGSGVYYETHNIML